MAEKITAHDLAEALEELSILAYWPSAESARAAIGSLLARMVPHREALRWLVRAMVDRVGEWKGPTELRGVLCWRYRPADGISADSTCAGFTAGDGERLSIEEAPIVREALPSGESGRMIRQLAAARGMR